MKSQRNDLLKLWPAIWIGLAVAMAVLLGGEWWKPYDPPVREVVWPADARWIRTADDLQSTACFRQDFTLIEDVDSAWVRIAAQGGFEITVNGDPVGAWTYWRSTRQFQNGLGAPGQRLTASDPAMALNFPREFQWTGHANHKTPIYFDIRPYLRQGKNAICIETEARKPQPAVILTGEIRLVGGSVVPINTNSAWLAEPVPVGCTQQEWVRPEIRMKGWREAEAWTRGPRSGKTMVPQGTFENPFHASWVGLSPLENGAGYEELVLNWDQGKLPQNAILRVATAEAYAVSINGKALRPGSREKSSLNDGGWLVGWEGRRPLATMPTLLDPDEVSSPFSGTRFENPRHGDPTANDFKRFENTLNRTRERPNSTAEGEGLDDTYGEKEVKGREADPLGYDEEAALVVPLEVSRIRNDEGFFGYGVDGMIRRGANELRIRLVPGLDAGYTRSNTRRIAAELVTDHAGGARQLFATGSSAWRVDDGARSSAAPAFNSLADSKKLPPMSFVGNGWPGRLWKVYSIFLGIFSALGARMIIRYLPGKLVLSCVWFAIAALLVFGLRSSLFERSEFLFFRERHWAGWALLFSSCIAVMAPLVLKKSSGMRTRGKGRRWMAFTILLVICFFVRGWKADLQPIDDDEFASIQGVASIVVKGVPEIGKDIWYTRSPMYHYVAAAVAWIFGTNLWTLRLFSVFTGVATGAAVWWMCRVCFKNRWIAVGSLALFALHPFLIFTSHIARFYQQQQLLITITAVCLMRGFVQAAGPGWILATVFSFGAAILSQEISIGFAPSLFVTYLLFGRDIPWRWEFKAGLAGVIIGALFVIDVLVFQMKCLTWTSGVSPNVEATIAPNFWELGNLVSMFIGYSRLHLLASAFLPFSLMAALRRGDRSILAMHTLLYTAVLFTNLLVTSTSFRYQYAYTTLWIPLCVHGVAEVSRQVVFQLRRVGAPRRMGPAIAALLGLGIILSWSPWRIPGSYDETLLGDPITPLRFVRSNLRSEDKVMITEPHPHAAKMELGQADYDLALPILYDFAYSDDGLLRDRNGDAKVINRLAQFQDIFAREERVWIVVNREKLRSRTRNLRWEYAGAREENFIRANCQLAFRSYLWHVYLWDRTAHRYQAFRTEPNQWTE
ncbi:ArnT family glycosyltransferase [Luteolibacter algae]|uniref:ArnT family glycosyltransferase n=1 Tax=Luteolibacter algae TaxID=454151 RepID=A0ABW5D6P8_9BACT